MGKKVEALTVRVFEAEWDRNNYDVCLPFSWSSFKSASVMERKSSSRDALLVIVGMSNCMELALFLESSAVLLLLVGVAIAGEDNKVEDDDKVGMQWS